MESTYQNWLWIKISFDLEKVGFFTLILAWIHHGCIFGLCWLHYHFEVNPNTSEKICSSAQKTSKFLPVVIYIKGSILWEFQKFWTVGSLFFKRKEISNPNVYDGLAVSKKWPKELNISKSTGSIILKLHRMIDNV